MIDPSILFIIISLVVFFTSSRGFQPSNFFGPAFGRWTEIPETRDLKKIGVVSGILVFLMLVWGMINMPDLKPVLDVYVILFLGAALILAGEIIAPNKYYWAFMAGYPTKISVLSGLILGVSWVLLSFEPLTSISVKQFLLSFSGTSTKTLFMLLLIIVMTLLEESFFAAVTVPSVTEALGIIPALAISSLSFGFFHYAVYQANIYLILRAITFRIAADSINLRFRSFWASVTAHMAINLIGMLA